MGAEPVSSRRTTSPTTVGAAVTPPGSRVLVAPVPGQRSAWRERIDAFPTQLVLVVLWTVIGLPVCLWLRQSILWVSLMSWYAIVVSHFGGHLAWRAKRAAQGDEAPDSASEPADADDDVERD